MLFKYLPSERLDVLENRRIRFTPLRSLNDPYESLPILDVKKQVEESIAIHSQELDVIWANTHLLEKSPENLKVLENNRKAMIEGVESELNSHIMGDGLMNTLGDSFGVLSLSRSNQSLLMWAHYADDNTGVVLGFDEEHEFFHQLDLSGNVVRPMPVVYSEKRTLINTEQEGWYQKLLCSKPLEWAYVQEERLFMGFMDEENAVGVDQFGAKVILYNIPNDAIAAVYLGCRASEETKSRAINAVVSNELKCTVYEARMSRIEFKIEFTEIPT